LQLPEKELVNVLRLLNIPHIGDTTAKKLLAYCGSPTAIFEDKVQHLLKIDGIGSWVLEHLHSSKYLKAAEAEYRFIEKNNIRYSYFMDSDYPSYKKHCTDGPVLL